MTFDIEKYNEAQRQFYEGQRIASGYYADQEAMNAQILIDSMKAGIIIDPTVVFDSGIDINHMDAQTGGTVLHFAAAYGMRYIIRLIVKQPDTDFLITDVQNRYPSTLAYEVARDFALGRYLMQKETLQAEEDGMIMYGSNAGNIKIE
ncbi:hypothetical protein [Terasakiella sp.]|uniref:hypothetical protein n=1 Tax=Terasakiella sp. TaxID=2034861 RepID=UPI003AA8230C